MTDPTSMPNFPPPSEDRPLRGRVLDVLQDEGFRPDLDDDGDVAFKVQGQQLFVRCMEGTFDVLRIFGQWRVADGVPEDLLERLHACNDLTLGLNCVKTGLANGTLVVASEHMVAKDEDVADRVRISINLVLQTVQMWHESFQNERAHLADYNQAGSDEGIDGTGDGTGAGEVPGEGDQQ